MSLAIEVRALSDRILDDLRAAHDYYEYSKSSWRLVRKLAASGRSIILGNSHTGTVTQAAELPALARRYITGYLAESVFQHFVALLEDFLFELLRLWLTAYPGGIPNKDRKPVDLAMVIDSPDREAILRVVVDRELNALKYERPAAWFRYLNARVKLDCPTAEQIERLGEIKASRDILAHNRGVVNQTYLEKSGARPRYKLGQRLEIPESYLHETWRLIRDVVHDLARAAIIKA